MENSTNETLENSTDETLENSSAYLKYLRSTSHLLLFVCIPITITLFILPNLALHSLSIITGMSGAIGLMLSKIFDTDYKM